MPDFTLFTYRKLLSTLRDRNYTFQTFKNFIENPARRTIILRHDVDARAINSLQTALIEYEKEIRGTYFFRMVPESYDESIIKRIFALGHSIGYHYEDLSQCAKEVRKRECKSRIIHVVQSMTQCAWKGNIVNRQKCKYISSKNLIPPEEKLVDLAMISFRKNLEKLRRVVPVETICMHGSPLSRWDNKLLWKFYDYKALGIIGEPYFDIDFNDVLYLTDTGRRWDGDSVSVRDKILSHSLQIKRSNKVPHKLFKYKSTFDIIHAAREGSLPDKIMITIHPQRWTNDPKLWLLELISQKVKNSIKYFIASRQSPA
jgi:hypothetical protein